MKKNIFSRVSIETLESMGVTFPKKEDYVVYREFAKKYYPNNANKMVIVINSEYNDNSYDNSFSYILVYDKDGNELVPNKNTAHECRDNWHTLIVSVVNGGGGGFLYETRKPVGDITIPLVDIEFELYCKVNN